YLRARLERRRPREGDAPRPAAPLVPLLCLELDRHMHVPPGEHDAVDRAFDEVIAAHEAKLGGREGILRLLDALHDIPRATLAAVYGPVPEGREDVAWRDRVAPGAGASLTSLLRRGASPPAARAALPPALTDRLYTAAVSRIQCVDEGDPEWWGEDPIEVVTCWGTRVAVGALPVEIVAHKSFSRGTVEELREARRVFGPRPVEGYLGLGVAVIELDELGVIDDLAALFCALLPAVLGGASERSDGALLVDRGELGAAPLVFEQLEDAIADVYAGLGKEVLLQGTEIFGDLSRGSQQRDLSMSTKEHAYTVTLSVSAVESEGRASG
ncbi:MAG: hypothetical protein U0359_27605, partial [Byssovorax sp.]